MPSLSPIEGTGGRIQGLAPSYRGLGGHVPGPFGPQGPRGAHPWLNIISMTDDVVALEETKGFTEFQWHWLDHKRFEGSEGGWENHFPSG